MRATDEKDRPWVIRWSEYEQRVHSYPLADLIPHPLRTDCACGPKVLPVICDGHYLGSQVVHHALDGRA